MKQVSRRILPLLCSLALAATAAHANSLTFKANGEELATAGFNAPELTKDGWSLKFDHVFVALTDITAYQTNPAYNAETDQPIKAAVKATLSGSFTVDLAKGTEEDPTVLVGTVDKVAEGHYNALSWKMTPAASGSLQGYSMALIGIATKDEQSVRFDLRSTEVSTYRCGEFVGDERKGFVSAKEAGDLELTFHLDHVFGRADKPADDPMNTGALGFTPFANKPNEIQKLSLRGLHVGHVGEGHCNVEVQ
jgi:hypothetical protein